MTAFFKSFGLLVLSYLLYKACVVLMIMFLQQSKFNANANEFQTDYGSRGANGVLITGSSNTRYDFDYSYLDSSFTGYHFRSVSVSAPYGLYFSLKKLKSIYQPGDKVLIDVPYTLYGRDQFLPLDEYTLGLMKPEDYKAVFLFSPKILFSYIFQESVCNPVLWTYLSRVKNKYKKANSQTDTSGPFWIDSLYKQDFGEEYDSCSNQYYPDHHFIRDVRLEDDYLEKVKHFINETIERKVDFLYPEINRNNNNISAETVEKIQKHFQPINSFAKSQFENNCMYDQNYHLNKCGAIINSKNLLNSLQNKRSD